MTNRTDRFRRNRRTDVEPVVTRREVVTTAAAVMLGAAAPGVADAESEKGSTFDTSQTDGERDAPGWTARAVTESVSGQKIKVVYQTNLEYFGASYEPHGDPETGPLGGDGSWKHTFVLNTQVISVRPWRKAESDVDLFSGNDDNVIYGPVLTAPNKVNNYKKNKVKGQLQECLNNYISELGENIEEYGSVNNYRDFRDKFFDPTRSGAGIGCSPEIEVSSVYPKDKIAVSARRDQNLYSFSDPEAFLSALLSGIDLFQAYAQPRTGEGINRTVSEPFDNYELLKRSRDRMADTKAALSLFIASGGMLFSSVGLATSFVSLGAISGGLGLAVFALGLIIERWLGRGNQDSKDGVSFDDGFASQHPIPNNPSASAAVMFDLYSSPGDETLATVRTRENLLGDGSPGSSDFGHIWFVKLPNLPDEPDYDLDEHGNAELVIPGSQAWPIEGDSDRQPPNPDEHAIEMYGNTSESSAEPADTIVRNGPEVEFGLDWSRKTDPVDSLPIDDFSLERNEKMCEETEQKVREETEQELSEFKTQRPVIEDGSVDVTFDASGTRLGGSSIKRYRWDLFRETRNDRLKRNTIPDVVFDGLSQEVPKGDISKEDSNRGREPPLMAFQVPLNSGQGQNEWQDGPLFNSADSLSVEHCFTEAGKYTMILTVEDRQGNRGQQVVPFTVERGMTGELASTLSVDGNKKRSVEPFGNPDEPLEPFQFRVEITDKISSEEIPPHTGIPVPGDETPEGDGNRYRYRWTVERVEYDHQEASAKRVKRVDPSHDSGEVFNAEGSRLRIASSEKPFSSVPGVYRIAVEVTDVLTGERDVSSATVEILPLDPSGDNDTQGGNS